MKKTLIIIPFLFLFQKLTAEIIVFKDCSNEQYNYEKNDYTIDLKKELMTREYTYSEESYKKLKFTENKPTENTTETVELSDKSEKINTEDKKILAEIKPISKKKIEAN